jgi:hypothetical protein
LAPFRVDSAVAEVVATGVEVDAMGTKVNATGAEVKVCLAVRTTTTVEVSVVRQESEVASDEDVISGATVT